MLAVAFHAELGEDERAARAVPRAGRERRAARGTTAQHPPTQPIARAHRPEACARKGPSLAEPHVAALSTTPVKSLRIQRRERCQLERDGARGDRAFFIVDERGTDDQRQAPRGLQPGRRRARRGRRARMELPDGTRVAAEPRPGEELQVRFYSLIAPGARDRRPVLAGAHRARRRAAAARRLRRRARRRGPRRAGSGDGALQLLGGRGREGGRPRADRHPALPDDDRAGRLRAVRRRRLDRPRAADRRRARSGRSATSAAAR